MSELGFITMAFGSDKYFQQALTLARSIKRNMPGIPIALVTDRSDTGPEFDIVVPMGSVAKAGTVHKIAMYDYSPFQETLFIDSDSVVVRPFHDQLHAIRQFDFSPIVGQYLRAGDNDLWLADVGKAVLGVGGHSFPKFNGGVYFFRKGSYALDVFHRAEAIRLRAEELGIKDFDRSGPGEETLIGLALASLGAEDLYFDHGKLMRTPLNSSGPIVADPITQLCHFIKEGQRVEPAIIPYCGEWASHPTYEIARRSLARGTALDGWEKLFIRSRRRVSQLRTRVGHKFSAVQRRLKITGS